MYINLQYSDSDKIKFLNVLGYSAEKFEYLSFTGETATAKAFETKHTISIVYKHKISTPLKKLLDKKYKDEKDFLPYSNELLHQAFEKEFSKSLLELAISCIK